MNKILLVLLFISGLTQAQTFGFDCVVAIEDQQNVIYNVTNSVSSDGRTLTVHYTINQSSGHVFKFRSRPVNDPPFNWVSSQGLVRNRNQDRLSFQLIRNYGEREVEVELFIEDPSGETVFTTRIAVVYGIHTPPPPPTPPAPTLMLIVVPSDDDHIRVALSDADGILTDSEFDDLGLSSTDLSLEINGVTRSIARANPYPGRHWLISGSDIRSLIRTHGAEASITVGGNELTVDIDLPSFIFNILVEPYENRSNSATWQVYHFLPAGYRIDTQIRRVGGNWDTGGTVSGPIDSEMYYTIDRGARRNREIRWLIIETGVGIIHTTETYSVTFGG